MYRINYNIRLDISKKIVPTWAEIKINSSNSKIKVITKKVIINSEDRKEKEVIRKFITIEGLEANIKGSIIALYKDRITESKIFVQPEEEFLYDEGMVFQPESITLSPNKSRKVKLLVYTKIIETGSIIKIKSDNNTVKYYPEEIIVNEVDAVRNITKYELEIWGEKTGENAEIDAEYSVYLALLDVKVTSKEKKQDQSSYSGMFNEPYFNSESNPHQRTSYSTKTGLINIYQNFPSIKFYLGNNLQYRKSMPSQVLIADLVAEQCFKVIAQKKIDRGGILFSPEAKQARIERDTYELSKKYGLKLHQALVDQELLKRSKEE